MTGWRNVLARALVVTACCGMLVACADAPASRGANATAASAATRVATAYPAVECAGCAPLARAQLAAKTPTGSGIVFVYDLGAERIYKYEVSPQRPVTEMIPVDKDVRVAFDALVTANRSNPDLVRAGRLRIQMPATLSDEPATSEQ
jgi:hypothetical protein